MFVQRLRSDTAALAIDESRRLVRLRRNSVRLDDPRELAAAMQSVVQMLEQLVPLHERGSYGLLMDMRDAPLLTEPELEKVVSNYSHAIRQGWRQVAVLIKTPVGKLQVRRTTKQDIDSSRAVFDDEIAAMNFLTGAKS